MYNHFFGFKERPFKLVPNPDYLFLSQAHEEALAHLRYAAVEGDGFVEIIGEVGTGKTMLCRTFLESLTSEIETAYIFNPKMDAFRMMQAICEEFSIDSEARDAKVLIDRLNLFLMERKMAGKQVLLLIDEAQNLHSEVLEQLRLLSNLETTRDKLLQIILVGQPELGDVLDSYELRQLGQRISLSYRLRPLSFAETRSYIQHRLNVAARGIPVRFTRSAVKQIHRFSGGIPRLINICCDRALLVGYGMGRKKIGRGISRAALRELATRGDRRTRRPRARGLIFMSAIALVFAGTTGFYLYRTGHTSADDFSFFRKMSPLSIQLPWKADDLVENPSETKTEPQDIDSSKINKIIEDNSQAKMAFPAAGCEHPFDFSPQTASAAALDHAELTSYLGNKATGSRLDVVNQLLAFWDADGSKASSLKGIKTDNDFFTLAALRHGLSIQRIDEELDLVRKLDLPAILAFNAPGRSDPVYMAVRNAFADTMILSDHSGKTIVANNEDIAACWSGTAYVFWKDFSNLQGVVGRDAPESTVISLKMHLRDIGYADISIDSTYDSPTQEIIRQIQAEHGLTVDGMVGPLTKIVLYNQKPDLNIPSLITDSGRPMQLSKQLPRRLPKQLIDA